MAPHPGEKSLRRALGRSAAQPLAPGGAGKGVRGLERLGQRIQGLVVAVDQIGDAFLEPARPGPAVLVGADDPTPKLGRLAGRKMGREGAVGGVEQVVALVEHVAGRRPAFCVVPSAQGRLNHHQGVVGDDDVGATGPADRMFDETAPVVTASRINAFAPGVGQVGGQVGAQKVGQPGREIAADHVAVAGRKRPPGHQTQRHGAAGPAPARHPPQ